MTAGPLRVFIEPSSHHLLNAGDVAMLEVCVERLRGMLPGARLAVTTDAPELLKGSCPDAIPVPATGRYRWLGEAETPHWRPRRGLTGRISRVAGRLGPAAGRRALRIEARVLARRGAPGAARFLRELAAADLVVLSGRGGLTDAFRTDSLAVLELLDAAATAGVPVALLGQGIGPIADAGLRSRASAVLRRVDLIALREGRAGPALLRTAGVPASRVFVTGDDAVEAAFRERPESGGKGIGVSLRVSGYSGLDRSDLTWIARALEHAGTRVGGGLVAVPISRHPHEMDGEVAVEVGAEWRDPGSQPVALMRHVHSCRVVVTGSYHAGVFALAQGIPVVGLVAAPYYRDKLEGLKHQFGAGCEVLDLSLPDAEQRLGDAVVRAYEGADAVRGSLLAAAERQVAAGRAAYARLPALISGRA